ncbi:MAG: ribosome small subunit-dependent GTPase, partial [bacterium]
MNSQQSSLFGMDEPTRIAASVYDGLFAARVTEQQRDLYTIVSELGTIPARVAGKMMHEATGPRDFPAVGDWVVADWGGAFAVIHAVLPR